MGVFYQIPPSAATWPARHRQAAMRFQRPAGVSFKPSGVGIDGGIVDLRSEEFVCRAVAHVAEAVAAAAYELHDQQFELLAVVVDHALL